MHFDTDEIMHTVSGFTISALRQVHVPVNIMRSCVDFRSERILLFYSLDLTTVWTRLSREKFLILFLGKGSLHVGHFLSCRENSGKFCFETENLFGMMTYLFEAVNRAKSY